MENNSTSRVLKRIKENQSARLAEEESSELRAYALAAMQGLCASVEYYNGRKLVDAEMLACDAWYIAEAMVKESNRRKNNPPASGGAT